MPSIGTDAEDRNEIIFSSGSLLGGTVLTVTFSVIRALLEETHGAKKPRSEGGCGMELGVQK